ncbi:hypothetical protein T08_12571, partial [Trichinella sp. T8]
LQNFLEFVQWQAGLLSKSRREETKQSASRSEQRTPSSKPSRPERRYGDRIRSTAAALAVVAVKGCPFFSGGHKAEECEKFQQADLSGRRDMARIKEVCFRCLETGHMAKGCRAGRPCGVDGCRQLHHKLLHPSPTTESPRSLRPDRAHQAYVPDENHVLVNCLFDTEAEVSFIRKDVADVLGLTGPHERCRLTTLGGRVGPERRWRRVEFRLGAVEGSGRRGAGIQVQALVIPRAALEERPVGQWPWLDHVRESRPESSPGGGGLPVTMRNLRRRRLAEVLGNRGAGNSAGRRRRCGWNRGDEGIGGGTPPGRGKVFGQPPLGARRACPPQQLFTRPTPAPGIRAALESARRRSPSVRFSHEAVLRRRLGGTCSGGKPAGEDVVPSPPRGLPGGGQRAKMSSGV